MGLCPVGNSNDDDDIDEWVEVAAELDHQDRARQAREDERLFDEVFEEELDSGEVIIQSDDEDGREPPVPGDEGGPADTCLTVKARALGVYVATVVDAKGPTNFAVRTLAEWILHCGLVKFLYRSDLEASLNARFQIAIRAGEDPQLHQEV